MQLIAWRVAVKAVKRVDYIDRKGCRRIFEQRFTAERMCGDYLKVYERIIEQSAGAESLGSRACVSRRQFASCPRKS